MSFRRPSKFVPILSAFIAFLLSFSPCMAEQGDSTMVNIFDLIRPSYEVMEFIAESEFVADYKVASSMLADQLKKINIFSEGLADDPKELHFKSKDGSVSIALFQSEDGNYLFEKWRTDHKSMSPKSDVRNDVGGGTVFFKVKTANGGIGSMFYTGRNLVEVVINLPFAVESFDGLDAVSQSLIKHKYETLYSILESIAHAYVVPSAYVFFPTKGSLTRQQRLYGLIQFWTEVKYNFAFFDHVPDLNWDRVLAEYLPIIEKDQTTEEYYKNLSRMCALLKDGHTNVNLPDAINAKIISPPVQLTNIKNKAIVTNIDQSLKEKVPIGSEVLSVDGIPTLQYLREQVLPYISSSTEHILLDNGIRWLLNGKRETTVNISYKTPDNKTEKITLKRNRNDVIWANPPAKFSLFQYKQLPQNVAYVALNTFGDEKIVEEFESRIDSINMCDKLIIDLRSNGGGNSWNAYRIIEHLTGKPFLTSKWRTREHRSSFKAWGSFRIKDYRAAARSKEDNLSDWEKTAIEYYKGDHWYGEAADTIVPPNNKKINLPIVVLIGHNTASAAEDFLIAIDNTKRARTVGSKTYGSTGQPLPLKLPGGGSARICTKRDEYPDGRQFVGYGVKPDVEIENSVEDVIKGRDPVLAKGLEVLNAMKK